jgi:CRISP-associated protein Cas1
MAWKGLHITRAGRLSLKDGQVVVAQEDGEARIPLEDIGWIILDEPRLTLTTTLLAACAEHNIAILTTDARHMPASLTLPVCGHHRQAGITALQLGWGTPFKKRCWQNIIRAKILHQAAVLEVLNCSHAPALRAMVPRVGSGDTGNVEAQAARQYWSSLFEKFAREDSTDLRNNMLNYGYAVLRAVLARALVASGFIGPLGLNHASQTNSFNLADDMIEPYRPFVDTLAFTLFQGRQKSDSLTLEDRRALAALPLQDVQGARVEGMNMKVVINSFSLLACCEESSASLMHASLQNDPSLLVLPTRMTS